jgi:hypothetical protein
MLGAFISAALSLSLYLTYAHTHAREHKRVKACCTLSPSHEGSCGIGVTVLEEWVVNFRFRLLDLCSRVTGLGGAESHFGYCPIVTDIKSYFFTDILDENYTYKQNIVQSTGKSSISWEHGMCSSSVWRNTSIRGWLPTNLFANSNEQSNIKHSRSSTCHMLRLGWLWMSPRKATTYRTRRT